MGKKWSSLKYSWVLESLRMGQTRRQVLFETRLRRLHCLQASKHGCFGFLEMIPPRLFFLPKRAGDHQRSQCSALPASPSPTWLSTYPSLGAIHCCRLYNDKGFTLHAKGDQKIKQTEQPNGEAEWLRRTSEVVFAWKRFSFCPLFQLLPFLFLACSVESEWCFTFLQPEGKTELQSQAAKWWKTQLSRDALGLDQELKAVENAHFST